MNKIKEGIFAQIDSVVGPLYEIADAIFDYPETGFQEHKACKLLCDWLRQHGFTVTQGVGGLETAFRAVYENGEGGPALGFLCEYDALPFGHACAHHLQGPAVLAAAEGLKNAELDKPFKLVIYGTPAEEGLQGKKRMLDAGCFRDIDLALMMHGGANTTVDVKSLAGARLDVRYSGVAAHASLTPELSRDALDGVLLALQGIEFMRGHVKSDVRLMYGIKECVGMPGSSGPTNAEAYVIFRTYHGEDVTDLEHRLRDIFNGAALMTGTRVQITKCLEMVSKLPSHALNKLILDNAEALGAPQILRPHRTNTGSTDFAFVSRLIPSAVCRVAFVPEGTPSHSQAFLDAGKSQQAKEAILFGAKILAGVAADLICSKEALQTVLQEHRVLKDIIERHN